MKIKTSVMALGLTSSLALFGCNENSELVESSTETNTGTEATSYSVKAIDGYLRGALVWLDINGNHKLDDGEPNATTGEGGTATLDTTGITSPESYPLVVKSIANETIDEDEPDKTVPNDFIMSAPAGVAQVTPLTTLIHIKVLASGGTLSAEEAKAEVAESLGIDEELMYSDYKAESSTAYQVIAFAAKSLVTSGVIPETEDEIAEAAEDTDGENNLLTAATTVSSGIKTKVEEVTNSGDASALENVVINSDGEADVDTDGDGVPDADDFAPEDESEWKDTDGDDVGDNSDAFPKDSSEWLDTDKDGYGDNSDKFVDDPTEWKDTDGDDVGDNSDAFPSDPSEWLDSDKDGYGDNSDYFKNDPSEWLDTDGDEVGNNADTDDDGDGVLDGDDYDSLNPEVGSKATVAAREYLNTQTGMYSLWVDEDDFGSSRIYVDTLSVSSNIITLNTTAMLKSSGEAIEVSGDSDLILTSEGWSSQSGAWAIDTSGFSLVAYPTDHTDVTYTLNGSPVSLDGSIVAESNFEWENYADTTAVFPTDSYMLNFTLTPNQDNYYLWDWQPYITNMGSVVQGASSLDELIFSDASVITTTSDLQGMDVGKDIYVKFIDDGDSSSGTAEYYSVSGESVTLVGAGLWTRSTINTADILEFSVPESVVTAWGESFNEPTNHMIVSVYDGVVYIGSKEVSGEVLNDDSIVLLNAAAKTSIINAAAIPLFKCTTGNIDNTQKGDVVTTDDYAIAIDDCYGATEIKEEDVSGKNLHRVRSGGGTRDYTFNSDMSLDIYKDSVYSYSATWAIESGKVKITYDGSDDVTYWALIDHNDSQWYVKWFEDYTETVENEEVDITEIWTSVLTLQDVATCSITASENVTFADYQAQISACAGLIPEVTEQDVLGTHLIRVSDNGETRAYVFEDSNANNYYKNGIVRNRTWQVNENSMIEMYYSSDAEPSLYFTLIEDAEVGEPLTFAVYDVEDAAIWTTKYTDIQNNVDIAECTYATNEWDDDNDRPLPFTSYSDFSSALEMCLEESGSSAKFSNSFMNSDLPRTMTSKTIVTGDNAGETESYTFNADFSGTYDYEYPGEAPESYPFTWSIDDETGQLTVILSVEDSEAGQTFIFTDYIYIVDTDGIEFSLKIWSHSDAWDEFGTDQGDSWSGIYTFSK